MNSKKIPNIAVLATSIALAMASTAASAASVPTATQLPGEGTVSGNGSISVGAISGGAQTIGVNGNEVINWGSGSNVNAGGVGGFNIGSGAALTFKDTSGGKGSAVLNIDSSGNASQIFGRLVANGSNVFVANENGVIVGSTARVSGTGTVSLIANKLHTDAANDFAGNPANLAYAGTGGDVTVRKGATIGNAVLISGGGIVNVDLTALTGGSTALSAGLASANYGPGGENYFVTNLSVSGQLAGGRLSGFNSAGEASSSGVLDLSDLQGNAYNVGYEFTNTGDLTLPSDNGFVHNQGKMITRIPPDYDASFTQLINDGSYDVGGILHPYEMVNNGKIFNIYYIKSTKFTNGVTGSIPNNVTIYMENGGNFVNKGFLSAGAISISGGGSLTNSGTLTADQYVKVTDGSVINSGNMDVYSIFVINGSLINNGTMSSGGGFGQVVNGSLVNTGAINGFYTLTTASDDNFTHGADYSIINSGSISSFNKNYNGQLTDIVVNMDRGSPNNNNDSRGSFINTGRLDADAGNTYGLNIKAHNEIYLGGEVTANGMPISTQNPLLNVSFEAANGVLTINAPLTVRDCCFKTGNASFSGQQVNLLANLDLVHATVRAGDKADGGYAVRIGNNATLSATDLTVDGFSATDHPNVMLQGTLAVNKLVFGGTNAVSDVLSGPQGGIVATGSKAKVEFDFTGAVQRDPVFANRNFRYNYLPITAGKGGVCLYLNPVAYKDGSYAKARVANILVNGNVRLLQKAIPAPVKAGGSADKGATHWRNTELVVQSTGNILSGGVFYWPGTVYLGNIAKHKDGSAAPGTLGRGTITLGGDFNNVLPGNTATGEGISFMTRYPLKIGNYTVTTNANSGINFGTASLTRSYKRGMNRGQFYGGTVGSDGKVHYGKLNPSRFHTQPPISTR